GNVNMRALVSTKTAAIRSRSPRLARYEYQWSWAARRGAGGVESRLARALAGVALIAAVACGQGSTPKPLVATPQTHSGPITVSPDGSLLYVVHPDADSV